MRRKIIEQYRIAKWHYKTRGLKKNYPADIEKLRLVIGPGRSGTSWLASMLSETSTPTWYLNEPIAHFPYRMPFYHKYDQSAVNYISKLNEYNPLTKAYKLLTNTNFIEEQLPNERLKRKSNQPEAILIKEVHSLLATEAIVNYFNVPCVVITRNPLYVVDSNITTFGLNCHLYEAETNSIFNDNFIDKFNINKEVVKYYKSTLPVKDKEKIITQYLIRIGIINKFLKTIAHNNSNCIHVNYENLITNTEFYLKDIIEKIHLSDTNINNIIKKFTDTNHSSERFSVIKKSKNQLNKEIQNISLTKQKEFENLKI